VTDTSKGQVNLSWEAPESDGGAPVLNYVVEMRPEKDNYYMLVDKIPGDVHTHTVRGLREGAKYFFKVRAENIKGTSEEAVELQEPVAAQAKIGEC
jgi:titin